MKFIGVDSVNPEKQTRTIQVLRTRTNLPVLFCPDRRLSACREIDPKRWLVQREIPHHRQFTKLVVQLVQLAWLSAPESG